MTRKLTSIALAAACMIAAVPVAAQDEPEEARTTYTITMLKFANGADERWSEMQDKYYAPAAAAAGLPKTEVHWMMDGPWDLMLVRKVPRGMTTFDAHASPERKAYEAAFEKIAGSADAAKKLNEENDKLVSNAVRYFSHTHP